MFSKIVDFYDYKNFGNKVVVYKGDYYSGHIFITVIKDREEIVYFIVDDTLSHMYPINQQNVLPNLEFNIKNPPLNIDVSLDIDLHKYGKSKCPQWLRKIIGDANV